MRGIRLTQITCQPSSHPTFANNITHSEEPMDPPLVREWMSNATNTPLRAPTTVEPNVQRLIDDLRRAEPFRQGDPEATPAVAYNPSPAADSVPLPPFFVVRHGRHRPMLSDLSQIHETQQLLMQRREASRRAAGKGSRQGSCSARSPSRCLDLSWGQQSMHDLP